MRHLLKKELSELEFGSRVSLESLHVTLHMKVSMREESVFGKKIMVITLRESLSGWSGEMMAEAPTLSDGGKLEMEATRGGACANPAWAPAELLPEAIKPSKPDAISSSFNHRHFDPEGLSRSAYHHRDCTATTRITHFCFLMYLLNTSTLDLHYFADHAPPYAILSHRWGAEEVSFQDVKERTADTKAGYKKLEGTCALAKSHGLDFAWIDTCCIDKHSSAELSEAINSMFLWYQEATVCYAYLDDVPPRSAEVLSPPPDPGLFGWKFQKSKWFTRGWTLQELLAPSMVIFLNEAWEEIGTKESLSEVISQITNIPEAVLLGIESIDEVCIATKMTWAAYRETTRTEDIAYCLMGIFNINMPVMYGERERAFLRLQEEILKVTDDHSIFAWNQWPGFRPRQSEAGNATHLAYFPAEFTLEGQTVPSDVVGLDSPSHKGQDEDELFDKSIFVDNQGIHLKLPLIQSFYPPSSDPDEEFDYVLLLPCLRVVHGVTVSQRRLGISLTRLEDGTYAREGIVSLTNEQIRDCTVVMGDSTAARTCIKRVHPMRRRALHLVDAARAGRTTEIRFLLGRGVKDESVYAPEDDTLHQLFEWNPRTSALVRQGLRPTALTHAVWEGHCDVVEELLKTPSGREQLLGAAGEGLLALPAMVGNIAMVDFLLRERSDKPEWLGHILGDASQWGNHSVVLLLLSLGVECNARLPWKEGRTPLSVAAEGGHVLIMEELLDHGADVDAADDNGRVALSWAVYDRNDRSFFQLLASDATVDVMDDNGRSPLSWAAEYGNQWAVEHLLVNGASCEEKDARGMAPLDHARDCGNMGTLAVQGQRGMPDGASPDVRAAWSK
ncbi:ankyrin repeat-containing domain protein [Podospora aff. communis PSN243]|uniref:Ankyrin repeat-containing domain protein n=1 Tax=Podospora aff. communis PSN243 TaxID=3040156 RepID=A0AAV9GG94_9PEZI|nr:ankyrin repeat-containing domain protein [Podospora aff. communis PSN243]